MSIVVLSSLLEYTGNRRTAVRISEHIISAGRHCVLWSEADFIDSNAFSSRLRTVSPPVVTVFGIHAYRSGRLLVDSDVPYNIVLGGTDINYTDVSPIKASIMAKAVADARNIICFTDTMRLKAMNLWTLSIEKLHVVPQSVDLDINLSMRNSGISLENGFCSRLGINDDALLFVLPAGIRPVKDVLFLADVFAMWHKSEPRVQLVIVGPILDVSYAAHVQSKLLLLDGGVKMLDAMERGVLWNSIAKEATAVVNTSLSEGMALSILEAMSVGVPVLARNIPGNDIICDGRYGIPFSTPMDFLSKAKKLIADDSESRGYRDAIVDAARLFVMNLFSKKDESAAYLNFI